MKKIVSERTLFKLLIDESGFLLSITMKSRAFYFFLCSKLIAIRTAPTTDPYPGIVEICGYSIPKIVANWDAMANLIVKERNAFPKNY